MPHANDCILAKLPGPGNVNDRLSAWLGGTGALVDKWHTRFTTDGIATGAFPDRMTAWLVGEGATGGTIGDLWNDYWCNIH